MDLAQGSEQLLGHCLDGPRLDVGEEDDELVAAHAGHVVGGAQLTFQSMCHLHQERVPRRVPGRVVDLLEPVEIYHEDREGTKMAMKGRELAHYLLVEPTPVLKPSEGVSL